MSFIVTQEKIAQVFTDLSASNIYSGTLIIVKTLAVSLIILNWIKEFIKYTNNPFKDGRTPISISTILESVLYMFLIISCTYFIDILNSIVTEISSGFSFTVTNDLYSIDQRLLFDEDNQITAGDSTDVSILQILGSIYNSFDPLFAILAILKWISWLVSIIVFPIFYIERESMLFIMKLVFPIVLAIGAFHQYRTLFWNWIKIYIAIFMTGMFFHAIDWITGNIYIGLDSTIETSVITVFTQNMIRILYFSLIIFAKVRLYRSVVSLSYKIFN